MMEIPNSISQLDMPDPDEENESEGIAAFPFEHLQRSASRFNSIWNASRNISGRTDPEMPPPPVPGSKPFPMMTNISNSSGLGRRITFSSSVSNFVSSGPSRQQTPGVRKSGTTSGNRRCISSGHVSSVGSNLTTPKNGTSCNIIALFEGRGAARGEIGMACIDLKHPVLILSQLTDTRTYVRVLTQLNITCPAEILMSSAVCDSGNSSKLYKLVSENFPQSSVITIPRKYFNDQTGMQRVGELCLPIYKTVEMEILEKQYCLAACAAVLKYVEFIQNVIYAPSSLKIVYTVSANSVMIDTVTAARLELVADAYSDKVNHSMFGILKRTSTNGGCRLLRANILQPPSDLATIETRLECVNELIEKEELFQSLKVVINQFADVEQIMAVCVTLPKEENMRSIEQKIANLICLKHALDYVSPLADALGRSNSNLFQIYKEGLLDPQFLEVKEKIGLVIHADARMQKGTLNTRLQKCFAVKPNINGLLDVARRTYTELVNDISDLVKQLSEEYELPFHVGYDFSRGFFIKMQCNLKDKNILQILPPCLIKVTRTKRVVSCTTKDLIKLNDRVKESLNEIYLMSNVIVSELLKVIRGHLGCVYKLIEAVSTIDFLLSLASYGTLNQCVKPKFSESTVIKGGRHPILEKVGVVPVVCNDTFLSPENNFVIITGANMSGKTTYLKQVALLQLLAQIGCYVPAEYACFRLVDHILSRMGSCDSIENNFSAFMLEMKEVSYILANSSERSLVVIDELGKSTSCEEGVSLAWAISEEIMLSKAFTLFATHHSLLTQLEGVYPNALNYHLPVHYVVDNERNSIVPDYTYSLERGRCKEENYGIKLAEMAAFPAEFIEYAKHITREIEKKNKQMDILETEEYKRRRETIQLAVHILQLVRDDTLDEEELKEHIRCIQQQFKTLFAYISENVADNNTIVND